MTDCPVCCEAYTPAARKPVVCQFCEYSACVSCVRQFLLSHAGDAQCLAPGCRRVWDRETLEQALPKTFLNGEYKRHRETVLLDRERAQLPATQPIAHAHRHARELVAQNAALQTEATAATKHLLALRRTLEHNQDTINYVYAHHRLPDQTHTAGAPTAAKGPVYSRGCPKDDCRGFLNADFVCGLCSLKCCKRCHEPLAADETAADDPDAAGPSAASGPSAAASERPAKHQCREEDVETAKALVKETRSCPTCHVPIYRIEGCDQMWCPGCHTSFSWRTGEVEKGRVHNPHYYEWLRRTNGGAVPRELGDVPCGGIPDVSAVMVWLRQLPGVEQSLQAQAPLPRFQRHPDPWTVALEAYPAGMALFKYHRRVQHIEAMVLPTYRAAPVDNTMARVRYLLGEHTEAQFKWELQKAEKKHQKLTAIHAVLQTLIAVVGDTLRNALAGACTPPALEALELELGAVRDFTNEAVQRVSRTFDCVVPFLMADYNILSRRFK